MKDAITYYGVTAPRPSVPTGRLGCTLMIAEQT